MSRASRIKSGGVPPKTDMTGNNNTNSDEDNVLKGSFGGNKAKMSEALLSSNWRVATAHAPKDGVSENVMGRRRREAKTTDTSSDVDERSILTDVSNRTVSRTGNTKLSFDLAITKTRQSSEVHMYNRAMAHKNHNNKKESTSGADGGDTTVIGTPCSTATNGNGSQAQVQSQSQSHVISPPPTWRLFQDVDGHAALADKVGIETAKMIKDAVVSNQAMGLSGTGIFTLMGAATGMADGMADGTATGAAASVPRGNQDCFELFNIIPLVGESPCKLENHGQLCDCALFEHGEMSRIEEARRVLVKRDFVDDEHGTFGYVSSVERKWCPTDKTSCAVAKVPTKADVEAWRLVERMVAEQTGSDDGAALGGYGFRRAATMEHRKELYKTLGINGDEESFSAFLDDLESKICAAKKYETLQTRRQVLDGVQELVERLGKSRAGRIVEASMSQEGDLVDAKSDGNSTVMYHDYHGHGARYHHHRDHDAAVHTDSYNNRGNDSRNNDNRDSRSNDNGNSNSNRNSNRAADFNAVIEKLQRSARANFYNDLLTWEDPVTGRNRLGGTAKERGKADEGEMVRFLAFAGACMERWFPQAGLDVASHLMVLWQRAAQRAGREGVDEFVEACNGVRGLTDNGRPDGGHVKHKRERFNDSAFISAGSVASTLGTVGTWDPYLPHPHAPPSARNGMQTTNSTLNSTLNPKAREFWSMTSPTKDFAHATTIGSLLGTAATATATVTTTGTNKANMEADSQQEQHQQHQHQHATAVPMTVPVSIPGGAVNTMATPPSPMPLAGGGLARAPPPFVPIISAMQPAPGMIMGPPYYMPTPGVPWPGIPMAPPPGCPTAPPPGYVIPQPLNPSMASLGPIGGVGVGMPLTTMQLLSTEGTRAATAVAHGQQQQQHHPQQYHHNVSPQDPAASRSGSPTPSRNNRVSVSGPPVNAPTAPAAMRTAAARSPRAGSALSSWSSSHYGKFGAQPNGFSRAQGPFGTQVGMMAGMPGMTGMLSTKSTMHNNNNNYHYHQQQNLHQAAGAPPVDMSMGMGGMAMPHHVAGGGMAPTAPPPSGTGHGPANTSLPFAVPPRPRAPDTRDQQLYELFIECRKQMDTNYAWDCRARQERRNMRKRWMH